MRLKILAAIVLFCGFSLVFSAQLTRNASAEPITGPVTGPITGTPTPTVPPVTGPVTSPVTNPVTMFKITGKVTYHFLGILRRGAARFMPAAGVKVKAEDIFTHHKVTTMTDANGNYVLDPGKKGFYKVTVSGGESHNYVPPVRFVNDKKGKNHVDFQGLIFKFHH